MAFFLVRHSGPTSSAAYHLLTYRRGTIRMARFAPDGQTVVYSAAWEGAPVEVFTTRFGTPESRPIGVPGAEILGISSTGEMALLLNSQQTTSQVHSGTLARMPLVGGAPREVLENVQWADWSPDGTQLAVVRDVAGRNRLEYPVGKVLYETGGWISHPRISRHGDMIAFLDHPIQGDSIAGVSVVDLTGKKTDRDRALRRRSHRPRLVAGRRRNLVYRNPAGNRSRSLFGEFVGKEASGGAGARRSHACRMCYRMDEFFSPATTGGAASSSAPPGMRRNATSPGWIGPIR